MKDVLTTEVAQRLSHVAVKHISRKTERFFIQTSILNCIYTVKLFQSDHRRKTSCSQSFYLLKEYCKVNKSGLKLFSKYTRTLYFDRETPVMKKEWWNQVGWVPEGNCFVRVCCTVRNQKSFCQRLSWSNYVKLLIMSILLKTVPVWKKITSHP